RSSRSRAEGVFCWPVLRPGVAGAARGGNRPGRSGGLGLRRGLQRDCLGLYELLEPSEEDFRPSFDARGVVDAPVKLIVAAQLRVRLARSLDVLNELPVRLTRALE